MEKSICTTSKAIPCTSEDFVSLQKEKPTTHLLILRMRLKLLMVGQACVSFVKKHEIRNWRNCDEKIEEMT